MSRPTTLEVLAAALALATGWVTDFGWRGLTTHPAGFQGPALLGGALVAAVGLLLRRRGWRWWQVAAVQLVVLGWYVDQHTSASRHRLGLLPTPGSIGHTVDRLRLGVESLATQFSPVPADFPGVHDVLLAGSLLGLLAVDVLACGLRRVPLAGLPVLVVWMFPISLLDDGLGWRVFAAGSFLFVLLVAVEESRRALSWGRRESPALAAARGGNAGRTVGLAGATCLGAVLLAAVVPLAHRTLGPGGAHAGSGPAAGQPVRIQNPIVDLRRDLVQPQDTPLVEARTDARDPRYLRLTVLDAFTGDTWQPSPRHLTGSLDHDFPLPPGLAQDAPGRVTHWQIRLLPGLATSWLPTPYPVRSVQLDDNHWRYDPDSLDIAERDGRVVTGSLSYDVVGFVPRIDPAQLNQSQTIPASILGPMTALPVRIPQVIQRIADRVTGEAPTSYAKARALQDWLRSTGGFTYSTRRAPGNGLSALADFLTVDKVGYCEQFASAFAVMARLEDLPTRVVVGFLAPQQTGPDSYLYTSDSLHAWPEVYFSGQGWVPFEPTPGTHTGAAPAWASGPLPSTGPTQEPTATPTATPTHVRPRPVPTTPTPSSSGHGWVLVPVLLVLALLLAAAPALLRLRARRQRLGAGPDVRAVADGLWAELRAGVHDLGLAWAGGRSVRQQALALLRQEPVDAALAARIEELVVFVERARYGRPFTLAPALRSSYPATVADWLDVLTRTAPRSQAWRARLLPRSVWSAPPAVLDEGPREQLVGQ